MTHAATPALAIVAALPEELSGLLKRVENLHEERRGQAVWQAGLLRGRPVLLATTGDGARKAEQGLERLLRATSPERLIVVGVAGGLSPELDVGSVVLVRRILSESGVSAELDDVCPAIPLGTAYSASHIAATPEEKARLARLIGDEYPAVVDLESAAFTSVARAAGVPILVLRAVSDRADESLPFDFERFRGVDGSVSRSRIVRHAVVHMEALPALLELRRRVELCAERLAYAVEEVLGP